MNDRELRAVRTLKPPSEVPPRSMDGIEGVQALTTQSSPPDTHTEEEVAMGKVDSKDEGHSANADHDKGKEQGRPM